jgi:hypothetical protein
MKSKVNIDTRRWHNLIDGNYYPIVLKQVTDDRDTKILNQIMTWMRENIGQRGFAWEVEVENDEDYINLVYYWFFRFEQDASQFALIWL